MSSDEAKRRARVIKRARSTVGELTAVAASGKFIGAGARADDRQYVTEQMRSSRQQADLLAPEFDGAGDRR